MSFNITVTVGTVPNLVVTAGVQSATMTWGYPTDWSENSQIEVWSGTSTFGAATKLITTRDNKFAHGNLTAGTARTYWLRHAKTFVGGQTLYSATTQAAATPTAATITDGSVSTVKIAAAAVTTRSTYEETGSEYVEVGTDVNDTLHAPGGGDDVWALPDIPFTGIDGTTVVTCICRQSETPIYLRGEGTIAAFVKVQIYDVTNSASPILVGEQEQCVANISIGIYPISTSPVSTSFNRDFEHNFFVNTLATKNYKVRFTLRAFTDNNDNYILWASDLRQIIFQVFKR